MNYTIIPRQDKKLYVITDIHGNLKDFQYYLNLWLKDPSNHIVFTGDLIHADTISEDYSLEILDLVKEYIHCPSFHCLLGNHELAQIFGEDAYRYNVNQTLQFKKLVEDKYPNDYTQKYNEYKNLLKEFEYFIITSNGLFLCHTMINEDYLEPLLNGAVSIYDLNPYEYSYEKEFLTEWVWSRPYDDYTEKTINDFLKYTQTQYIISGHTNYNGCHIYGNQLIFDSSHNTDNKLYLEINLNNEYENIISILKQLKELE